MDIANGQIGPCQGVSECRAVWLLKCISSFAIISNHGNDVPLYIKTRLHSLSKFQSSDCQFVLSAKERLLVTSGVALNRKAVISAPQVLELFTSSVLCYQTYRGRGGEGKIECLSQKLFLKSESLCARKRRIPVNYTPVIHYLEDERLYHT